MASKDEAARAYYESELIFQLDQNGRIAHALKQRDIEIVKRLLKHLDVETIAKEFDMAVEEVEALRGDSSNER